MSITWERITNYVQAKVASLAAYVITSHSTSKGYQDSVRVRATGPGEPEAAQYVRRIWPFGLRGVPVKDCEGVAVRIHGGRRNLAMVAAESLSYGRTDLKDGEVQLYNKTKGCEVFLDENGAISIKAADGQKVTIDAGAGADVVVNGGSAKVGRVGDEVDCGSLSIVRNGSGAIVEIFWCPPGAPFPAGAVSLPLYPVTDQPITGKISTGADHFKG